MNDDFVAFVFAEDAAHVAFFELAREEPTRRMRDSAILEHARANLFGVVRADAAFRREQDFFAASWAAG